MYVRVCVCVRVRVCVCACVCVWCKLFFQLDNYCTATEISIVHIPYNTKNITKLIFKIAVGENLIWRNAPTENLAVHVSGVRTKRACCSVQSSVLY